ncbi:MAG TPA: DUF1275 family protein, partial [Acetobacteraceae bacterium]|nr:DUF1275 family protein [Acetobacteraceae bacterium]
NLYAQIGLWTVAMGTQSVNARKINLPGINTVVFTTTLTMIVMGLTRTILRKPEHGRVKPSTTRQMVIMLVYAIGAAASAALAFHFPKLMTLPPLFAVGAALAFAIPGQAWSRKQS